MPTLAVFQLYRGEMNSTSSIFSHILQIVHLCKIRNVLFHVFHKCLSQGISIYEKKTITILYLEKPSHQFINRQKMDEISNNVQEYHIYVICICLLIVVSNTYCVEFFVLFVFVLCTLCCQFLWFVHF
jgi:hypothetical protein